MAEQLQIQVQANVSNAVTNLNNLQKQLAETNTAAVKTGTTGMQTLSKGAGQANTAMINLGRTVSDAPFGFIGIANNIGPLVENFVSLRKEAGSNGGALKALGASLAGPGGLIVGLQLAVAAVQFAQLGFDRWVGSTKRAKEETEKQKNATENLKDAINSVTQSYAAELAQVTKLVSIAKDNTASTKLRGEAINELNKIAPEYFNNLRQESDLTDKLTEAYNRYVKNIKTAIEIKVLEKQLEANIEKQLKFNKESEKTIQLQSSLINVFKNQGTGLNAQGDAVRILNDQQNNFRRTQNKIAADGQILQIEQENILSRIVNLQKNLNQLDVNNKGAKNNKTKSNTQKNLNDLIKEYNAEIAGIRFEGQIRGLNVSNQLLETNLNFLTRAAKLVGQTGNAYKIINKDTEEFAKNAADQKIVDVITAYQNTLSELDIKQAVTGQDQLNARINAATDALIKLQTLGLDPTNQEIIKLQNTLNNLTAEVGLREIRKRTEEITKTWARFQLQANKLNFNATKSPLDALKSRIDLIGNAITELKSKGLTDKDLGIGILSIQFEQLGIQFEKLKAQKDTFDQLQQTISGGLTNAFSSVFEAIANGEDAFQALGESVKRLALDLIRVIIQMTIVKAIANAIAPGIGGAAVDQGFQIRGDYLQKIMLMRSR